MTWRTEIAETLNLIAKTYIYGVTYRNTNRYTYETKRRKIRNNLRWGGGEGSINGNQGLQICPKNIYWYFYYFFFCFLRIIQFQWRNFFYILAKLWLINDVDNISYEKIHFKFSCTGVCSNNLSSVPHISMS